MDVKTYLERIAYQGAPPPPTLETLRALHLAHLLTVPFENLSIHYGEPISLELAALYQKIVLRRRGGFCYELNGLFAWLLAQLGFNVVQLSAGVARPDGSFGPEFDHLVLLVTLEERWLVDVGFGDSFRQPLKLDSREPQPEGTRAYRIAAAADFLVLQERASTDAEAEWKDQYRFTLRGHALNEYAAMCHYHQTSPLSTFTQKRVCSLARPQGRVTISGMRLLETAGNVQHEHAIATETEYADVLEREFGIVRLPA